MFRFIVLASVLALSVQGQYNPDPKTAAIISEQRYLSGDGKFGAAYVQEDGIDFKEETDADGSRRGSYSYIDPNGQKRTISYTAGKNGFQATGDHLLVPPPAPAHAQLAAVQAAQYNANNYDSNYAGNTGAEGFDDGQYDPRYNDPGFEGNFRAAAVQPNYVHTPQPAQPQYVPQAQPQPQPQQQAYHNNLNNINYNAIYQSTTPNPHRFQPPGKLSLSRTPDGFSYSFNKV